MSDDPSKQVTRVLRDLGSSEEAKQALLPLVYDQLRAIAENRMSRERADHTLQATALVHEAFLRLVNDRNLAWEKRKSFYLAASEAMRRILLDHARKRGRLRRGGDRARVPLDGIDGASGEDRDQILALDEAIGKLEAEDPRAAEVVRLRFYAGLSVEEAARVLETSERTVHREWSFARARLFQLLRTDPS